MGFIAHEWGAEKNGRIVKCTHKNGQLEGCKIPVCGQSGCKKSHFVDNQGANLDLAFEKTYNQYGRNEVGHMQIKEFNVGNLEWCTHLYNMNYGHVKEKISSTSKGRQMTPEQRAKCASAKGKKWINNGTKERLAKKDEVPSFLMSGYKTGRLKNYVRKSKSISR